MVEETKGAKKIFGRIGIGYTGFLSASIVLQIVLRIVIWWSVRKEFLICPGAGPYLPFPWLIMQREGWFYF